MVTLIENTVTDEELRSESSQKLLIINKCPLGVFLSLKIPLYLMKPGFLLHLSNLNVKAMCGFVQPLNGNLGSFIVPPNF